MAGQRIMGVTDCCDAACLRHVSLGSLTLPVSQGALVLYFTTGTPPHHLSRSYSRPGWEVTLGLPSLLGNDLELVFD